MYHKQPNQFRNILNVYVIALLFTFSEKHNIVTSSSLTSEEVWTITVVRIIKPVNQSGAKYR